MDGERIAYIVNLSLHEEGDQNPRLMHGAIQAPTSPEQSLLVQPELNRQPEKTLERPTQDARKLEEAPLCPPAPSG